MLSAGKSGRDERSVGAEVLREGDTWTMVVGQAKSLTERGSVGFSGPTAAVASAGCSRADADRSSSSSSAAAVGCRLLCEQTATETWQKHGRSRALVRQLRRSAVSHA